MLLVTKIREDKRWSKAELSRRSGINATSMSRIENGKEPAYPKRGKRIANALGWTGPVDELFQEVPEDGADI